jgi:predicted ArsR family transcriptional regulator
MDLSVNPERSTAREIADRIGGNPKTIRRVLDTKLVANRLAVAETRATGRGRPAKGYRLDPSAGRDRMDEIAESFGVLDWHERTAERYERERGGYREVQRQRQQREALALTDRAIGLPTAHASTPGIARL